MSDGLPVIKMGRALESQPGNPLISEHPDGRLFAIYPQGGQYPPHELNVGSTRGGKTAAARYRIIQDIRLPGRKALHLADGKYSGSFKMFDGQPGVVAVANTPDEIRGMVHGFREQVEHRYEALTKAKDIAFATRQRAPYEQLPPQKLWLDEYMNWAMTLPDKDRKTAVDDLVRIGQIGGQVRCMLRILTQRPDSAKSVDAGLPGLLKSLLMARSAQIGVVGMHKLEALMAFDDADAARWIEDTADRAGLSDRRGLGGLRIGRFGVVYKTPWVADALDPEATDEDITAAWSLLPVRPTPEQVRQEPAATGRRPNLRVVNR